MISFLDNFAPREKSPTTQHDSSAEGVCQSEPQPDVSQSRLSHTLTDGEREAAIGLAASLIEHHTELFEISGCFTDQANADRARLSKEALIKGRKTQPKESHDGQA